MIKRILRYFGYYKIDYGFATGRHWISICDIVIAESGDDFLMPDHRVKDLTQVIHTSATKMGNKNHSFRIRRQRVKGYKLPEGAVCVSRPSKWGNPFPSAHEFRLWLENANGNEQLRERREWILTQISTLRGKKLACWCKLDVECHADVLCEMANTNMKE